MKTPEISGGWRHFKGNISFVSFGGGTHNPGSGRPLSSELLGPQGGGGETESKTVVNMYLGQKMWVIALLLAGPWAMALAQSAPST